MHIKKTPYQFWNYQDTRKRKKPKPKPPELLPLFHQNLPEKVTGYMSHHLLLPLKDLPEDLVSRFKFDLTLENPTWKSARKYGKGFVSYAIPEYVRFYTIDKDWIGLPRSIKMSYVHKRFAECGMKLEVEDIRPEFETVPFPDKGDLTPFFYQKEAIEKILAGNIVLQFKCGKGKTMMALMAVSKYRLRTLILVRTRILLKQWVEAVCKVFDIPEDEVGIYSGKTKRHGLITVATQQSFNNLTRNEKRQLGETYGHVIFDEAHETAATIYRELLTYFKARKVTGLTATPEREDGMTPVLKLYIGPIVQVDDLGELDTEIWLRKTPFTHHFEGKKDKYHELIENLIHNHHRNLLIIKDLRDLLDRGETVICYSSRIEHMEILRNMFALMRPETPTAILASEHDGETMSTEEQEEVRKKLRNGELRLVFGGKIIEQGFDAPPLSAVVLATPSKSRRLIEQVLGRAQREHPGKKKSILLDYVDEKTKVLLWQFFAKNRRVYSKYPKKWLPEL